MVVKGYGKKYTQIEAQLTVSYEETVQCSLICTDEIVWLADEIWVYCTSISLVVP